MALRLLSIASARPNFVKLAGVHHAFMAHAPKDWEHIIIHTGQHYDPLLSDVFFQELKIPPPQENLGVKGGVRNEDTVARTKEALLPVLTKLKPDLVLVYGDVSGALAGAQAAHELKIPIAHIEAGLRSFDPSMPEEGNRKAIDHLAQFLFVTEKSGVENLEKEGIKNGVHLVGNTMIDTLMRMQKKINNMVLPPSSFDRSFGVVTLHRPSNVDTPEKLKENFDFLRKVAQDCPLILVLHPRTVTALGRFHILASKEGTPDSNMMIVQPYGYLLFLKLISTSQFILTDSGGLQEETTFLQKKCFTLRKNTERPATLEENEGSNTLIDLEKPEDQKKVLAYAKNPSPPVVKMPPLWDGRAGERILDILQKKFA